LSEKCCRQAFAVIDHHMRRLSPNSPVGRAFRHCAQEFIDNLDKDLLGSVVDGIGATRFGRFHEIGAFLLDRAPTRVAGLTGDAA
jgi:hypothetical protein